MTNGSDEAVVADRRPWFRGVPRYAWVVLALAALGWLFDTMDQNLFNLVRQGRAADAVSAVEALALHRDSPDIRRQVEKAANEREAAVKTQFKQSFARLENA